MPRGLNMGKENKPLAILKAVEKGTRRSGCRVYNKGTEPCTLWVKNDNGDYMPEFSAHIDMLGTDIEIYVPKDSDADKRIMKSENETYIACYMTGKMSPVETPVEVDTSTRTIDDKGNARYKCRESVKDNEDINAYIYKYSKKQCQTDDILPIVSLMCGCGGMDIGFEGGFEISKDIINKTMADKWDARIVPGSGNYRLNGTRFRVEMANDRSQYARAVWKRNMSPRGTDPECCIEGVTEELIDHPELFPENTAIVTASIETRYDLDEVLKMVKAIKPKMFIIETLLGVTPKEWLDVETKKLNEKILENAYIIPTSRYVNEAEYGVPQSRERLYLFGFNRECLRPTAMSMILDENIPDKCDYMPPKTNSRNSYVTANEALSGLAEPEESDDPDMKAISLTAYMGTTKKGKRCRGQTEIPVKDIALPIRSEHHGNIEFRRLSRKHGGQHTAELNKGYGERRLTVRECARLQTFPDSFKFVGSYNGLDITKTRGYELVGNATPPLFAYAIAKNLEKKWNLYFW